MPKSAHAAGMSTATKFLQNACWDAGQLADCSTRRASGRKAAAYRYRSTVTAVKPSTNRAILHAVGAALAGEPGAKVESSRRKVTVWWE